MDFFKVVRERRSIRAFKGKPIEEDKLQRLLDAMNRAPSAGNLQAYEVYVVRDAQLRAALMKAAADQEFLAQAPVVLVFCAHGARAEARYNRRGVELYSVQDATIACTHAMLAATALGLSTVWVGKFEEQAVAEVVGAPAGHRPVAVLPIGYAAESPKAQTRRNLDDLVHLVR
jgi:nitroreductase